MKQDNLTVISHPLVKAKITQMRDKNTTTKEYYTVNGEQRAIAHIVIDSTKANKTNLSLLEDILYGSENYVAHLPTPEEIYLCLSGEEEIWAEDQEDGVLYIQQVWNAQDQENGVLYVE